MAGYPKPPNSGEGDRSQSEQIRRIRTRRPQASGSGGEIYEAHTFSFHAPAPILNAESGTDYSPHRFHVGAGESQTLVALEQTDPPTGTCTVYWRFNGSFIDGTDLPITLATDDLLAPSLDADTATEYVSGHFTVAHSF